MGGSRFELIRRGDETALGACYEQVPVRLMPPFAFDGEPASLLYLITLTAGLMDGDGHLLDLVARRGTRAMVTGQAATRIHPSLGSFASQQWNVEVEDDACLVVLPGPAIPFRGSRYYQRARVDLAPSSRLVWGDIWLAGRYDRGELSERFAFERIVQDLEIRRDDQLLYRDRFAWEGPWTDDDVDWYTGGHLATAGLFFTGDTADLGEAPSGLRRSIFPLESGDTCVRWCGEPSAVTADLVHMSLTVAGRWTGGPDAPPWLLRSSELAPNHWFSTRGS